MTEVPHTNEAPSRKLVAEHMLRAERSTISVTDPKICAFFPTSIELVNTLLTTGTLLDKSDMESLPSNHVSVWATQSLVKNFPTWQPNTEVERVFTDPDELTQSASGAAEDYAQAHALLSQLNVPFTHNRVGLVREYLLESSDHMRWFSDVFHPETSGHPEIRALLDLLPELPEDRLSEVPQLLTNARERRGFLVGLESDYPFNLKETVAENDYHVAISFGFEGIPYKAISQIQPLGLHEVKFMQDLRKESGA